MIAEKIDLYAYFGAERKTESGYLNVYIHSRSKYYPSRIRPAMIVIAGGGYSGICEREGEPIALAYFAKGFDVFTLEYSCVPHKYPTQLTEGCMAIAYVKSNAETFGIDPELVAVAGFSAGGHLAAMTANLFDETAVKQALKSKSALARPDAVVLGYPVISSGEFANESSIANLAGNDPALREKISLEKQVTAKSSPAFIWATVNDDLVPSENALLYALSCKKSGVPFALHLYEDGRHGLGLANRETATPEGRVLNSTVEEYVRPDIATWFDMSLDWLESKGFTVKDL